jgi:hypothetical protein
LVGLVTGPEVLNEPGQVGLGLGHPPRPVRLGSPRPVRVTLGLLTALQLFQRGPDVPGPGPRVGPFLGQLIAAGVTEQGVLGGVDRGRLPEDVGGSLGQPVLVMGGRRRRVRGDLRAVDRDHPDPSQPGPRAQQQHLGEHRLDPAVMTLPEAGDRGVVRAVLRADHPDGHIGGAQPFDLAR